MRQDLFYLAAALKPGDPELRCILENNRASRIVDVKTVDGLPDAALADVLYAVKSSALPVECPASPPPCSASKRTFTTRRTASWKRCITATACRPLPTSLRSILKTPS